MTDVDPNGGFSSCIECSSLKIQERDGVPFRTKGEILMVKAQETTERTYRIPGTWTIYGEVEVQASSFEEAKDLAKRAPLPSDGVYVEDSFAMDEFVEEIVRLNTVHEIVFVSEGKKTGPKLPVGKTAVVYGIKEKSFIVELGGELVRVPFQYAEPIR